MVCLYTLFNFILLISVKFMYIFLFFSNTNFEQNKKNGITGFSDERYGFIDEPIYKNAKQILKNI